MKEIPQNVKELVCVECGATYREGEVLYTCPQCGPSGILDIQYDYDRLEGFRGRLEKSSERSLWRYGELLPVTGNKGLPRLRVGWTPVYDFPELADRFGLGGLRIKDDTREPSTSSLQNLRKNDSTQERVSEKENEFQHIEFFQYTSRARRNRGQLNLPRF